MERTGDFIHRVKIQAPSSQQSESGEIIAWPGSTLAQRWAAILPRTGREFNALSLVHGEMDALIAIMGRVAVTPDMRVFHDGRVFEILAAFSPDGKSPAKADVIHLVCRERVGEPTNEATAGGTHWDDKPGTWDATPGQWDQA